MNAYGVARGPTPSATSGQQAVHQVSLSEVAEIRVVEGPATIKGENGLLRNYVRLSARGRDSTDFVAEARAVVDRNVRLPGVYLEWTGEFEHELRARNDWEWSCRWWLP